MSLVLAKKNDPRLAATVTENHLANHCYIVVKEGQGDASGTRKKVMKKDLKPLPPATRPDDAPVVAEEFIEKDGGDADVVADAWQSAADVFG